MTDVEPTNRFESKYGREYHEEVIGGITFDVCDDCLAIVADTDGHDEYHIAIMSLFEQVFDYVEEDDDD